MRPARVRWLVAATMVVLACGQAPSSSRDEGDRRGARGERGSERPTSRSAPPPASGRVEVPERDDRVVEVAVAGPSTCARLADGRVRCWGVDDHGEHGDLSSVLGVGEASTVALPGPAAGLYRVGDGPARGSYCARLRTGSTWCWGAAEGQVGRRTDGESAPFEARSLAGIRDLDGQGGTGCAIDRDGEGRCWGAGHEGQLGDGKAHVRHRPAPVHGLSSVAQVSVGRGHVCAVHGEGGLSCWGRNVEQQVAPGDPRDRRASPTRVRGLPPVVEVAAGDGLSCAREASGQLWCWGRGSPNSARRMPTADAVGLAAADRVCAVRSGRLDCYGDLAAEPLEIPLEGSVGSLAVGATHECHVSEGAVRCRGENRRAQLGDGSYEDRTAAVAVTGLTQSAVAPGPAQGAALIPPDGCRLGPLELRQAQFWTRGPFVLRDAEAVVGPEQLRIVLSAAPMDRPLDVAAPLRGEQRRVEIQMVEADAGSLAARYTSSGEGPTFDLELVDVRARRRLTGLDTTGSPIGLLEITRDDEWICGTLDLHARLVTVRGPFAVRRPTGRR